MIPTGTRPFENKVALIAGASKGIGAGTAMAFAEAGATVALGARSADGVREVVSRIGAAGNHALPIVVDVGNERSMTDFVDATLRRFGRLDSPSTTPPTGRARLLSPRSMSMPSIGASAPMSAVRFWA